MAIDISIIINELDNFIKEKEKLHGKIIHLSTFDVMSPDLPKMIDRLRGYQQVYDLASQLAMRMQNLKTSQALKVVITDSSTEEHKPAEEVEKASNPPREDVNLYKKVPRLQGQKLTRSLTNEEIAKATNGKTYRKIIFNLFKQNKAEKLRWLELRELVDIERPDNPIDDMVNPDNVSMVWEGIYLKTIKALIREGKLVKERDTSVLSPTRKTPGPMIVRITDEWESEDA